MAAMHLDALGAAAARRGVQVQHGHAATFTGLTSSVLHAEPLRAVRGLDEAGQGQRQRRLRAPGEDTGRGHVSGCLVCRQSAVHATGIAVIHCTFLLACLSMVQRAVTEAGL